MTAAATILAAGAKTDDPYLVRVLAAHKIYAITGQAIHPWEVDSYPDDWYEAIKALADTLPKQQERIRNIKQHGRR